MPDYSFDKIGERLLHPEREPLLAEDDHVRVAWLIEKTPPTPLLLDIGSSDGTLVARWQAALPFIFRNSLQAVAVEPHPGHRASLAKLPQTIVCPAPAEAVVGLFQPQSFETIWCGEVLEHLTDTAGPALLTRLRPLSGRLVVTVPNRDCATFALERQRWQWPDHRRIYTVRDLRADLQGAGWFIERLEPIVGETVDDSIWIGAVCS